MADVVMRPRLGYTLNMAHLQAQEVFFFLFNINTIIVSKRLCFLCCRVICLFLFLGLSLLSRKEEVLWLAPKEEKEEEGAAAFVRLKRRVTRQQ